MIINIDPFPAVRVNWKGWRFMPRAIQYHNNIKQLRSAIENNLEYWPADISWAMVNWAYNLTFYIKMPKSWSKKKKAEYLGTPHRQTPDIDNLYKAFTDTIFYNDKTFNDKEIYDMRAKKFWAEKWYIEFNLN